MVSRDVGRTIESGKGGGRPGGEGRIEICVGKCLGKVGARNIKGEKKGIGEGFGSSTRNF